MRGAVLRRVEPGHVVDRAGVPCRPAASGRPSDTARSTPRRRRGCERGVVGVGDLVARRSRRPPGARGARGGRRSARGSASRSRPSATAACGPSRTRRPESSTRAWPAGWRVAGAADDPPGATDASRWLRARAPRQRERTRARGQATRATGRHGRRSRSREEIADLVALHHGRAAEADRVDVVRSRGPTACWSTVFFQSMPSAE